MAYCAPRGLPHSEFLRWDADDRDKALTWLMHDLERCPSCGTRPEDWDPEHGGDRHAYAWEPRACRGCEVKAQGDTHLEQHRAEYPRGTDIVLRRNT